eukprot:CAMPEP_0197596566 /NCGR_PEP_ID=MMETSP1326-20131121/25320_1 /TAXON_ID=1155430 /ORGANISM="Genus nov. species nov., Strain RCC2288" /LENGTH=65 /DNA_ID=CAMNT_0043163085 /DNA_START=33 /DNA_END=226 /DNA_ORIENTATION=-
MTPRASNKRRQTAKDQEKGKYLDVIMSFVGTGEAIPKAILEKNMVIVPFALFTNTSVMLHGVKSV